jgi:hypothetical protein
VKIYDEDVRPLLEIVPKDDKKKSTTSKAVRKLAFIDEKAMNPKVGPGAYPPLDFQSGIKVEEKGVKYKDFKKLLKEKKDKDNARIREEKDRIEEIKGKIKGEVQSIRYPFQQTFLPSTSIKSAMEVIKRGRRPRAARQKVIFDYFLGKGFGGEERFSKSDIEKWKKVVETFNAVSPQEKPLIQRKTKRQAQLSIA